MKTREPKTEAAAMRAAEREAWNDKLRDAALGVIGQGGMRTNAQVAAGVSKRLGVRVTRIRIVEVLEQMIRQRLIRRGAWTGRRGRGRLFKLCPRGVAMLKGSPSAAFRASRSRI